MGSFFEIHETPILGTFGLVSSDTGVFLACKVPVAVVHTSIDMHGRKKETSGKII